jgi:hypothetical protein
MKLGLIISNDWELYGDGSGDYFEIQYRPLQALLDRVETYGAKLTVMAEVGQQWAHKKISEKESGAREIVDSWESILMDTVKRKNDVQLHLHPQWLNAEYKNKKWNLDFNYWAISRLPEAKIEKVLEEGKQYLDSLLKPINPDYECIAFRAGAYCIEPSQVVIQKLLKSGIICDTSVSKGMYNPSFYDYRDAYSNVLPWFVSPEDIKYKGNNEARLLEIPIYSNKIFHSKILRILSQQLSDILSFGVVIDRKDRKWLSEKNDFINLKYPSKSPFETKIPKKLVKRLILGLISRDLFRLDYDSLPPKVFMKCLKQIYENKSFKGWQIDDLVIPVMAIGHVKLIHNYDNIDRILKEITVNLQDKVIYWTLSDAIRYWINKTNTNIELTLVKVE